jgi:hypothetical protein
VIQQSTERTIPSTYLLDDVLSEWYLHSALYKEILYTRNRAYPCKNAYAKYGTTALLDMDLWLTKSDEGMRIYTHTCLYRSLSLAYLNLFIEIFVDQDLFDR